MKKIIFVAIILVSVKAFGADSTTVRHAEPPIRLLDSEGAPIPAIMIPVVHEKDCCGAWQWGDFEWLKLKHGILIHPEYYFDPVRGSNGGYVFG